MRKKKDILEDIKSGSVTADDVKVILEVLIDIRDILSKR